MELSLIHISRLAGLTEIPALIKDISDTQAMEIALIENLQREDLDPVEEALGYRPVSYTHLDVDKRQSWWRIWTGRRAA